MSLKYETENFTVYYNDCDKRYLAKMVNVFEDKRYLAKMVNVFEDKRQNILDFF